LDVVVGDLFFTVSRPCERSKAIQIKQLKIKKSKLKIVAIGYADYFFIGLPRILRMLAMTKKQ
jgi:hypothetical protein